MNNIHCHVIKDTSPKLKQPKAIPQPLLGHTYYMRPLSNNVTSLHQSPSPTFDQSLLRHCSYIIYILMPPILSQSLPTSNFRTPDIRDCVTEELT